MIKNAFLRSLLWFGFFPNLLFALLGYFVYMRRPWINVDYLSIAFLAVFLPRRWTALLLALVLGNDVLGLVAPIYHFPLADLFRWWRGIFLINWSYSLPLTLIFFLFVGLVSVIIVRLANPQRRSGETALALFGCCVLACAAPLLDVDAAYSGTWATLLSFKTVATAEGDLRGIPLSVNEAATGRLLEDAASAKAELTKKQIVVIVVESMGVFKNAETQKQMLAPLLNDEMRRRYKIAAGTIPFHGHTIDGEFRELCGLRLTSYGEEKFPKCLPSDLKDLGFETIAFHGFTGQFYQRYSWYPKLGFEHVYFAEEMHQLGIDKTCGSGFQGVCDTSVAELVHKELLDRSRPKFVYWMTLNSHLPMDPEETKPSTFDCAQTPETHARRGVCLNTKMIHLVLSTIEKIALDPKLPPTEFVVTGDHMPPFASSTNREFYSPKDVPFIVLKPSSLPDGNRSRPLALRTQ